jgi:hypothetical protein
MRLTVRQLFAWWKRIPVRALRCSAWDSHTDWLIINTDGNGRVSWALGLCPACGRCVEVLP